MRIAILIGSPNKDGSSNLLAESFARGTREWASNASIPFMSLSEMICYPDRLVDLFVNAEIPPAVNQIECHPFYQREYDLAVMKDLGVTPMAWAPLAEGGHSIWNHPVLSEIARKHGKSVAQIALRFNVQRGVIVIPKTVHESRMAENIGIWDFELNTEDMDRISELDTGHTEIIDHLDIGIVKFLNQHKIHD